MDKSALCCKKLRNELDWSCREHQTKSDCPDALIDYWKDTKEFVLLIHDGGNSGIVIEFCPWCGSKLPSLDE